MARSLVLQQRPYTFAQTNLSPSFFACDKAADHTFRVARHSGVERDLISHLYRTPEILAAALSLCCVSHSAKVTRAPEMQAHPHSRGSFLVAATTAAVGLT